MYRKLGEICLTLKGKQESIPVIVGMKDVGAGKGPRYQPSCAEFVKLYVEEMIELNIQASSNMRSLKQGDDLRKLIEVQRYTLRLQVFESIGPVRSQAICQLTALFGLIPLDFYSYLPMHLSGGPGNFLRDLMGFDTNFESKVKENNALLEWNVKTVTTLQKLYNKELTYNKFENLTCEISRQNMKNDFFSTCHGLMRTEHVLYQRDCSYFSVLMGTKQINGHWRHLMERRGTAYFLTIQEPVHF